MQSLSAKGLERIGGRLGQPGGLRLEARPVDLIPHQRVADMGEVDPDLVRPPGFELAGEEARDWLAVGARKGLKLLPMRHGFAAVSAHRHLVARMRVPTDRLVDGAAG